jgi:hypothetical protein
MDAGGSSSLKLLALGSWLLAKTKSKNQKPKANS